MATKLLQPIIVQRPPGTEVLDVDSLVIAGTIVVTRTFSADFGRIEPAVAEYLRANLTPAPPTIAVVGELPSGAEPNQPGVLWVTRVDGAWSPAAQGIGAKPSVREEVQIMMRSDRGGGDKAFAFVRDALLAMYEASIDRL